LAFVFAAALVVTSSYVAVVIADPSPRTATTPEARPVSTTETIVVVDENGRRIDDVHISRSVSAIFGEMFEISKRGYETVTLHGPFAPRTVVRLVRVLPVIGSVTVATGTEKNLHAVPFAASAIDRSTIALAQASSVDRLLRALPGFDRTRSNSAFTNYGQLRASFSGAGNDRGAVLVDGTPAQDGFGGQIDWQAYPSDEVQRVELLRGAGSALYGSGAIGGTLDIATFAPRTGAGIASDGRLALGFGTNDDRHSSVQLRTPIGSTVGLSFSGVQSQLAYADLPPAFATPIDRMAVSTNGATHLRARFDDGKTSLDAAAIAASDRQDEGRPNYAFDRSFRQIGVTATRSIGALHARLSTFARDTTIVNLADVFPAKPGTPRYVQHVPTTENGFAFGLAARPNPALDLSLAIDGRRVVGTSEQAGPTGALQARGSGAETTRGIGVQGSLRFRRGEVLVGVRADAIRYENLALVTVTAATPAPLVATTTVRSRDEGAVSPRAALRYDLSPALALRVSSGGGFRAPYLNELVRGFNIGAVVMAPNPALVPERSRTDGAGLDALFDRSRGRATLDIVQTRVSDAIAFATVSPILMQRRNIARTQTDGETLTLADAIGACARLRASATTQYARTIASPGETAGKRIAFVPERAANLGIDAAGRGALAGSLDVSYVGQTFADDLERQPLGAALLIAATLRATTNSGTSFSLIGENLTHQTYLSSIDRFGTPLGVAFRIAVPLGPAPERTSSCAR